jgi:hypothetical protein
MLGGGNRGVVGPPAVAVAAPAPADVHVRVESRTPDLVLHAAPADGSRSGFAPVCAAPCEATLRGGTYEMAISVGAGEPVPSMVGPIRLDHDTTLALEYQSADGLRVAGGVTLGVGYFLGAETNLAMFSVGIGLVVIAPITGLILLVQGDSISVRELAAGVRF